MEESEFEMILDGNVFGEAVGFLGGRLSQDILSIEAKTLVCDFCGVDLDGS